ncbi:TraR/DksA family transcriptional regulator [Pseudoduganella sp. GCM10020061]|uniref:TraR/DksA family transcriptional regulator n=1 Tax=Pseudoduganella sp. GCM10020061 TaxID=3317345 RepID=UPI00363DB855
MAEPLTQEDIRQLEASLIEERKLLVSALSDRLHQGDNPEEMSLGNNMLEGAVDDRSTANMLNDEEISELGLDLRELRAVESALERIAQGSYGICANCSSVIGADRMRAQPTAALCITCQTEAERRPGTFAEGSSRMRL